MTQLESLQKKSMKIVEDNRFCIQVTNYHFQENLKTWLDWFEEKKIKTILKPSKGGSVAIFREVTPEEVAEIKTGVVIIRNGAFCEVREENNL